MPADFRGLLDKYITHTITAAEREELFGMIASGQYDEQLGASIEGHLCDKVFEVPANEALADAMFANIEAARVPHITAPVHRVHLLRRSWFRYAAASVLLLGAAVYFWPPTQPVKQAIVEVSPLQSAPGKQGALLTLDDGSTMVLDSLGNGVVTQANGTQVSLQNGQLQYAPTETATVGYHVMTTPRARQFSLVLPDGTKVWLNCASSIRYPTTFSEQHRTVEVTGEAYFEVAQDADQPFFVKLPGNVNVQVLGTSFNVNAYNDEPATSIVLVNGAVAIQLDEARRLLKPGEKGTVDQQGGIVVSHTDVEEATAWKNGQFQLSGANIPLLCRQLSRWYDTEIITEGNLPAKSFTSSISRDVPLNSILKALETYGIHARTEHGKIIIAN